jgi:hypothetical protein
LAVFFDERAAFKDFAIFVSIGKRHPAPVDGMLLVKDVLVHKLPIEIKG